MKWNSWWVSQAGVENKTKEEEEEEEERQWQRITHQRWVFLLGEQRNDDVTASCWSWDRLVLVTTIRWRDPAWSYFRFFQSQNHKPGGAVGLWEDPYCYFPQLCCRRSEMFKERERERGWLLTDVFPPGCRWRRRHGDGDGDGRLSLSLCSVTSATTNFNFFEMRFMKKIQL